MIDPEFRLSHGERAQLAAIVPHPGFHIYQRLMRSEVDKFIVAMINANPAEPQEVLTKHLLAKSAAQFLEGVSHRVTEEVEQYTHAPRATDKPKDITEGILDLGDFAEQFADVPNLLEEIN